MNTDNARFDRPLDVAPQAQETNETISLQPRTATEIQDWLVAYVAPILDVSPEEVDASIPFERYGLDSADAVGMTGDLADWLGFDVDPTLPYDYPTIEALSQALAEEYNRIVDTTSFNGEVLLDGSFGQVDLQWGFGQRETISFGLGAGLARLLGEHRQHGDRARVAPQRGQDRVRRLIRVALAPGGEMQAPDPHRVAGVSGEHSPAAGAERRQGDRALVLIQAQSGQLGLAGLVDCHEGETAFGDLPAYDHAAECRLVALDLA